MPLSRAEARKELRVMDRTVAKLQAVPDFKIYNAEELDFLKSYGSYAYFWYGILRYHQDYAETRKLLRMDD